MKPYALTPVALAAALAATTAAWAQADASTAAQTIVVTGSAAESALRDAPASIAVLTRSDIEKRPVQEIADLLGTVPGVTLSRNGNAVPGVQLRGLAAAYTLVLIDGKRVNSTSAVFRGNDYDMGWVPAEEIERIEVVRGPMSSLYGSDAIGGVVNIITRRIGKAWRGSVRVDAVQQENQLAGDSQIFSFSVAGPIVTDTLGLKIYGGYDKRDADDPALNPASATNGTRQPAMPQLENKYISSQLVWTPSADHDVLVDFDRADRDHGGFLLEREAYSLRHKGRYSFGRSELRVYADETRNLTGTVTGQVNPNKAQTRAIDGRMSLPVEWGVPQTISFGGEIRNDKLTDKANLSGAPGSTPRSDPSTEVGQKALFIEDEIRFTDSFALTLGDRYDRHDNFGGNHSPRAYGVLHITPQLTLKGGVARAFRAPTLLQNSPDWGSVSCGSPTVGCFIVGSTLLEPETSTSREIGLAFDSSAWSAGLTVFDNKLRNMIDITNRTSNVTLAPTYPNFVGFLPDGRPIFRYQNINSVRTRGVEASARAVLTPDFTVRAAYTYTDAKNTSGAIELPLTYRSRHVANVAADWQPLAGWSFGANARFNGAQYISVPANGLNTLKTPGYTLFDLTAAWQIDPRFTLRAGALNATDRTVDRESSLEFNEDGRRWFVSLGARF